ncbi:MAG TPA: HIT family protein [Rubrobacter sp.]
MATVFTRIIEGELPGRFVWKDERCVAFLSITPLKAGHTLVVPREEVDHWLDLEEDLAAHLLNVSCYIGKALQKGFQPAKVGLLIAGLEVLHTHIHLVPIDGLHDLDFDRQERDPDPAKLDEAAGVIRRSLRELGFEEVAD